MAVLMRIVLACWVIAAQAADTAELARKRHEAELAVVLTRPGATVCRLVTAGLATSEWIRGTVVQTGAGFGVRIDFAGTQPYTIEGAALAPGQVLPARGLGWVACDVGREIGPARSPDGG